MDVTLRPMARADFGEAQRWFEAAHVRAFWTDQRSVEEKYGPRVDGDSPFAVWIVEVDGVPAGVVQTCPADAYAWWPSQLGLDQAVIVDGLIGDPALVGRGIGTVALECLVERALAADPSACGVAAATEAANSASCRVLEKAGFTCVFAGDLERDGQTDRRVFFRPR